MFSRNNKQGARSFPRSQATFGFIIAPCKKEPEPNTSCSIQVLFWRRWRDIEPPRSARGKPPGGFSPIGLSCGLQRLQAAPHFANKKDTDERCLFYWRRWGNAIHVHNTLYSLRWLYYITEILPCQQILPTVAPRGITLPLAFSSASPPRSRHSCCLA